MSQSTLTQEMQDMNIDSDMESTDVSSVEMTDTETEEEEDYNCDDNDDSNSDKAIEEIKYYQRTTHNLIPFENFSLLVQEILQDFSQEIDIDDEAILALQAAAEDYLIKIFEQCNMNAIHANRQEIQPKDLYLARYHNNERC